MIEMMKGHIIFTKCTFSYNLCLLINLNISRNDDMVKESCKVSSKVDSAAPSCTDPAMLLSALMTPGHSVIHVTGVAPICYHCQTDCRTHLQEMDTYPSLRPNHEYLQQLILLPSRHYVHSLPVCLSSYLHAN